MMCHEEGTVCASTRQTLRCCASLSGDPQNQTQEKVLQAITNMKLS